MTSKPRIAFMIAAFTAVLNAGSAFSQNFPTKPVRIVSGSTSQEYIARLIAQEISGPLGQPVIVDTRPSVVIAAETVARSQPDGHTVVLSGTTFYVTPSIRKMSYDPIKDFTPLTMVGKAPLVLYVTPSLPVKSVKELIAYAKAKPGELNHSIGALGSGGHLSAELFKAAAGINMVAVPYSSGSQEMTDLVGGRLQLTIAPPSPLMDQVKAGKLRALAVTTLDQSALAPGLPPIAATLPGYEWINMTIMAAPANTPKAAVNRLYQEIARVLKNPNMREKVLNVGTEPVGNTPEELGAGLIAETRKIAKLAKDLNLNLQ